MTAIGAHLARLARLEIELGVAETRALVIRAAVAAGVGLAALGVLLAALVVLGAAALAPAFGAAWQHLALAGGLAGALAATAGAWSARRLRRLGWPRETLASWEETWRWLAALARSRPTSR
ncbi:MAG: phage holin family protein [Candidatus Rokubacteria bacterium]|nr:phage holin family protein [Candidatus Rokubacteria bacterium]